MSSLLTILFSQPRNELLWWDHANLLLLCGNAVEKVCQARQQVFLLFLLGLVCQHILTERPAEVQGLEHRVTVARVPELPKDNRSGSDHGPGKRHLWEGWGEGEGHPPGTNRPAVPASECCSPCQKTSHHRWPAGQQGMNSLHSLLPL